MTVKQLKRTLNQLPDDAEVIIENNHMYKHGFYTATSIECADNKVYIESDYRKRVGE